MKKIQLLSLAYLATYSHSHERFLLFLYPAQIVVYFFQNIRNFLIVHLKILVKHFSHVLQFHKSYTRLIVHFHNKKTLGIFCLRLVYLRGDSRPRYYEGLSHDLCLLGPVYMTSYVQVKPLWQVFQFQGGWLPWIEYVRVNGLVNNKDVIRAFDRLRVPLLQNFLGVCLRHSAHAVYRNLFFLYFVRD